MSKTKSRVFRWFSDKTLGFYSRIGDRPFIAVHPTHFFWLHRVSSAEGYLVFYAGRFIRSYFWSESISSCFPNSFAARSDKDDTTLISYQLNFWLLSNSNNWYFTFTIWKNVIVDAHHRCHVKRSYSETRDASLETAHIRVLQRHQTGALIPPHLSHQGIHYLWFLFLSDRNLIIQTQYKSGTLFSSQSNYLSSPLFQLNVDKR